MNNLESVRVGDFIFRVGAKFHVDSKVVIEEFKVIPSNTDDLFAVNASNDIVFVSENNVFISEESLEVESNKYAFFKDFESAKNYALRIQEELLKVNKEQLSKCTQFLDFEMASLPERFNLLEVDLERTKKIISTVLSNSYLLSDPSFLYFSMDDFYENILSAVNILSLSLIEDEESDFENFPNTEGVEFLSLHSLPVDSNISHNDRLSATKLSSKLYVFGKETLNERTYPSGFCSLIVGDTVDAILENFLKDANQVLYPIYQAKGFMFNEVIEFLKLNVVETSFIPEDKLSVLHTFFNNDDLPF